MNLSALLYLDMDPNDPQAPMGPTEDDRIEDVADVVARRSFNR